MPEKKRIMILGAGVLQRPGIIKAKEMGYEVIAVDMDPNAMAFQDADIKLVINTIDIPAVLAAAKEYAISGIMTLASDMPVRTIACVGKAMGFSTISEEAAFRATDKHAMRKALREHNVPIPVFFGITSEAEYLNVISKVPGNCFIVKPADNAGSRGVYLVSKEENPLPAFRNSKKYSRSGVVMVEEYMTGPEVSVESLTVNGKTHILAITDKIIAGNGNFIEMGHTQPSALPEKIREEIKKVVYQTIQAIGIDFSPSHAELKVTPDGVKVVEIGARLGGDNITTDLVPLSTGVDMLAACIRIAMMEPMGELKIASNSSAVRYFNPPLGRILDIRNVEQVRAIAGVQRIQFLKNIGDNVIPLSGSTDRTGCVIAQGYGDRSAAEICEEAVNLIHFVIEETPGC